MVQLYRRKGAETLVNTETSGAQGSNSVAALSTGGFIVTWVDDSMLSADNSEGAIKAQRFDADGNKVGGEFLVNTAVVGFQGQPKAAALDGGRFVVTWTNLNGDDADGPDSGIKGQVFNADGSKSGGEFLINSATFEIQLAPAVTALAGGGFVVSWSDFSGMGGDPGLGVKLQIFDQAGAKVGGELLANTVTAGSQTSSTVTALASGGFAVAWVGPNVVKCQVFDALGAKVGAEQQVNMTAISAPLTPSMTALGSGFVVVWSHGGDAGDADGFDVTAQLFDAAGAKIGGEFSVNTSTAGDQRVPEVRTLPDGHFLVTWQGPGATGPGIDLYGQFFTAAGAKAGGEFVINGVTSADQVGARIAILPSGDIVITWADNSGAGDGDSYGIKMVILTPTTNGPTDIALSNAALSETIFNNISVGTLTTNGALNAGIVYAIVSDSTGGAFRIDGDRLVVDDNERLDFETDPTAEVRIRATDSNGNSYEETMTLAIADAAIEARYSAGDEFRVNVDTEGYNNPKSVTALAGGGFVVVTRAVGNAGDVLRGHIFDAAGEPVGTEFDFDLSGPPSPVLALAALPSGGFVVAFEGPAIDLGGGSHAFPIHAQMFDAAGNEVGPEFEVSTDHVDIHPREPGIATLELGGFVVTWLLPTDEPGGSGGLFVSQITAQIFDADGDRIGGEFRVNTGVEGAQELSQVVALPGGGFAVTWREFVSGMDRIEGQIFDAAGAKVGGEFTVHSLPTGGDFSVAGYELTALESGNLVVSWVTLFADNPPVYDISARMVDPNGGVGNTITLIAATLGSEYEIAALPGGGFVLAASSLDHVDPALDDIQTFGLIFDGAGARVGDGFMVPQSTLDQEAEPHVAALGNGDIVFTWTRTFVSGSGDASDGYARILTFLSAGGNSEQQLGGPGDDVFFVNHPGDLVIEAPNQGRDVVYATVNYGLQAGTHVEILSAASLGGTDPLQLSGNELNNEVYGNAGANILRGGGGVDLLLGGFGDDIYYLTSGGEIIFEYAGQGRDLIYTGLSHGLAAGSHVEVLSAISLGSTDPLQLSGNELNQEIYGNAGANVLRGGGGTDLLLGGFGDDEYYITSGGETIFEYAGQGRDIIYSDLSHGLAAGSHVEILSAISLSSTAALNFGGNELDNYIYGNAGMNILYGGGGLDTLVGGGGDDTYYILGGSEVLYEDAGGGRDTVYTNLSYTLTAGAEVEILSAASLGSADAIGLTGNSIANGIFGNAGANTIDGKGGADYLAGGGGVDSFAFTTALGGGNVDTIADFLSGTDRIHLDDALFAGLGLGALPSGAFATGAAATELDDRIVYNSATGQLLFDADGSGGMAAVQFASVNPGTILAASDFTVI